MCLPHHVPIAPTIPWALAAMAGAHCVLVAHVPGVVLLRVWCTEGMEEPHAYEEVDAEEDDLEGMGELLLASVRGGGASMQEEEGAQSLGDDDAKANAQAQRWANCVCDDVDVCVERVLFLEGSGGVCVCAFALFCVC